MILSASLTTCCHAFPCQPADQREAITRTGNTPEINEVPQRPGGKTVRIGYQQEVAVMNRVVLSWWLMLLTLPLIGCDVGDDDGRLEHHVPPHRPANFTHAVRDLEQRLRELDRGPVSDEQMTELLDIVRWLPEIAGDSDLRKPDWDTVQQTAERLEKQLQNFPTEGSSRRDVFVVIWKLWDSLEPLVPKAGDRPDVLHDEAEDNGDASPGTEPATEVPAPDVPAAGEPSANQPSASESSTQSEPERQPASGTAAESN